MKRKALLTLAVMSACMTSWAVDGDLLDENFESQPISLGDRFVELSLSEGWQIVNKNDAYVLPHRWCVAKDSDKDGTKIENIKAWVDACAASTTPQGYEPEKGKDYLITPVLNLDGQYELSFQWASSSMALDKKQYDLKVVVYQDGEDVTSKPHVFSILDPEMVLESGIQPTDYGFYQVPWVGWQKYVSKVDLTPWQGQRVRIAFVYEITGVVGSYSGRIDAVNSVELDNIRVYPHQAATTPVATPSVTRWNFGEVYVGSHSLSDVLTLTNTGTAGLKITGFEAPAGFSVVLDRPVSDVNLKKNEALNFQIGYDASLTSAASGKMVIKTNGVDAEIEVSATKRMLAEDEAFEGFESDAFPPAGWTSLKWRTTSAGIEGKKAATPDAYYMEENYLRSPRIDASSSPATISFSYADIYNGETDGADTEVRLEFSKDGGQTWEVVDTYDYQDPYNEIVKKTYSRNVGSDNCYWQFVWNLTYYDSEEGAAASLFYLDAVVLNGIYGAGGVPSATTAVYPVAESGALFNRGVRLQWNPAQFATGYKLYVGTDVAATNLVDGLDVGQALAYDLPVLEYATTYNWKVVPYNGKGEAQGVSVWSFSTISDPTVKTLPYFEGFDNGVPPTGWNVVADGSTSWCANEVNPYAGTASAMANPRSDGNTAILETPDVEVSAPAFVSFYWGDAVAVSLKKDDTGNVVNTTDGSDGISDLSFEILVDGEWVRLALLSDKTNPYWIRERFDLSPYVGKTVAFRWVYTYYNYMKSRGACVDAFAIESSNPVKLSLNAAEWDAGKLNHDEAFSTESIYALYNDGSQDAEIKTAGFAKPNFSSTLKVGDKIPAGKSILFSLGVSGGDADALLEDALTVTTVDGSSISLPVKAEVLPSDVFYSGFERDAYGSLSPSGFTVKDVDGRSTVGLTMVDYAHKGEPMAFVVMNYKKADWSICYPNTGDQCLVTFGADADGITCEDWIISPELTATGESTFEFYCRDYLKDDDTDRFGSATASVLVSTEGPDDLNSFELVRSYQVPHPHKEEYTPFVTDLSAYAGQNIWVGLRHKATDGLSFFYDDFTYSHFGINDAGVGVVSSDDCGVHIDVKSGEIQVSGAEVRSMAVLSMSGMAVATVNGSGRLDIGDLAQGIYIVTVTTDDAVVSRRFIKK